MGKIAEYSASRLLANLDLDTARYARIPGEQEISSCVAAIEARGIGVLRAKSSEQAMKSIRELIPPGAQLMNGSSTTLIEIGYQDLLDSGKHPWQDLHKEIVSENNAERRSELRRRSVASEYFVSGVNAIAMSGELVSCDATGSRVGSWPFAARRLILVSGVNKIVPTLNDALLRVREFAFPLENARSLAVWGLPSQIEKCVIIAGERQPGRISLVLVDEILGY